MTPNPHREAEAALPIARTALVETLKSAAAMCERYSTFISEYVRADDLELHPYLPELEGIVEDARALLAKLEAGEG
jgi:hypothetical protein